MHPVAFLLLLLIPTVAANRPILLDTCPFDGATDGTFPIPVVGFTLSNHIIKNQQIIILTQGILNGGTSRHRLQAAVGARLATVTDGTFITNGKGRCQNKNEGKKSN